MAEHKKKKITDEKKTEKTEKTEKSEKQEEKKEKKIEEGVTPKKNVKSVKQQRKSVNNPEVLNKSPKSARVKKERSSIASSAEISAVTARSNGEKDYENFAAAFKEREEARKADSKKRRNSETESKNESEQSKSIVNMTKDQQLPTVLKSIDTKLLTPALLSDLEELLKDPSFRLEFLNEKGYDQLSIHLVRKLDSKIIIKLLHIITVSFTVDSRVFEYLFTKSAYMITTLVWLLVKLRTSDPHVVAKVYELLGSLPEIAARENFSEKVIQKTILSCFTLYNQKANESKMFHHLLWALEYNSSTVDMKIAIIHLINQTIDMFTELESRISMRLQFSSMNLDDILEKIYNDGNAKLKEEIDKFNRRSEEDSKLYSKTHDGLVSDEMINGSDIASIIRTYSERWSTASPSLRKIVAYTLCDLLHIPTDDNHGISHWLFLHRIISHLGSNYKTAFISQTDVDFEKIVELIEVNEVELRDKISDRDILIEKFRNKVASMEETNTQLENRIEELQTAYQKLENSVETHQSGYKEKIESLQEQVSSLTQKLNEALAAVTKEKEKHEELHREAEQTKTKLEQDKKKLLEALAEEKLKNIGGTSLDPPKKSIPKIDSIPQVQSVHEKVDNTAFIENISDLDKEEKRMFKALSKFTTPSNTTPANPPPATTTALNTGSRSGRSSGVLSSSGITTAQSYRPTTKTSKDLNDLPEWKRRQLEKEIAQAEKLEAEQQKKLELIKNSTSHPEPVSDVVPEWKQRENKELQSTDLPLLSTQSSEISEKELQRLEKTMNRYSVKKI